MSQKKSETPRLQLTRGAKRWPSRVWQLGRRANKEPEVLNLEFKLILCSKSAALYLGSWMAGEGGAGGGAGGGGCCVGESLPPSQQMCIYGRADLTTAKCTLPHPSQRFPKPTRNPSFPCLAQICISDQHRAVQSQWSMCHWICSIRNSRKSDSTERDF